mmetsp:Transcript_70716/g.188772  ORF Transcript_70716/g.188772 Transcript_70716/m.188772 type:complete len:162 (-) Transcript_70716:257-742(-)
MKTMDATTSPDSLCADSLGCEDVDDAEAPELSLEQLLEFDKNRRILAEGTLEKRGFWNPSWKARYFVLDNRGRMCYYKSKETKENGGAPSGRIGITNICIISRVGQQEDGRMCFDLQIPTSGRNRGRTYHLSASNVEDYERWVQSMADVGKRTYYTRFEDW